MSDEKKNYIISVEEQNGELVDPSISKYEDIDGDLVEISQTVKDRSELTGAAIKELQQLAIRAQTPDYYDALAKMVAAGAKEVREMSLIAKLRADLVKAAQPVGSPDQSAVNVNVQQNNFSSHSDVVDRIRGVIDGNSQ